MKSIQRLLREDIAEWQRLIHSYEEKNKKLLVPADNSIETLHEFNVQISEFYTYAYYDYARARRNKDAIERLIESTLRDAYPGSNESARKAAALSHVRNYPVPGGFPTETINLYDLEDLFCYFYSIMDATIQTLKAKAESKVTSNSLLKIEQSIV